MRLDAEPAVRLQMQDPAVGVAVGACRPGAAQAGSLLEELKGRSLPTSTPQRPTAVPRIALLTLLQGECVCWSGASGDGCTTLGPKQNDCNQARRVGDSAAARVGRHAWEETWRAHLRLSRLASRVPPPACSATVYSFVGVPNASAQQPTQSNALPALPSADCGHQLGRHFRLLAQLVGAGRWHLARGGGAAGGARRAPEASSGWAAAM